METDETFTIGVAPPQSGGFTFGDLTLIHVECGSGRIKQSEDHQGRWWYLRCGRCSRQVQLHPSNASTGAIAVTAVDGVRRPVKYDHGQVFVVQVEEDNAQSQDVGRRQTPSATTFRIALVGGSTVDILAERYGRGGYSGELWQFYSGKSVVATFEKRTVGAIVRVDHIASGTELTLRSDDEQDSDAPPLDESVDD